MPARTWATRSTRPVFSYAATVESLGADCVEKEMRSEHVEFLDRRLADAGLDADPETFKRYGSARELYNFHPDDVDAVARGERT